MASTTLAIWLSLREGQAVAVWHLRRRVQYSVGFTMTDEVQDAVMTVPPGAWTPAYDGDGRVRDGAWVAELTGLLNLSSWPKGMRVIVRKERPHPGA